MALLHINGLVESSESKDENLENTLDGDILIWANRQVENTSIGRVYNIGVTPKDGPTTDDRSAVYSLLFVDPEGIRRIVVCWLFSNTETNDEIDTKVYYRCIYNRNWVGGWLSSVPSQATTGEIIKGSIQINPNQTGSYREGMKIAKAEDGKSLIALGVDPNSDSTDDMWVIQTQASEVTGSEVRIYCLDSDGRQIGLIGNRKTKLFTINTNLEVSGSLTVLGQSNLKAISATSFDVTGAGTVGQLKVTAPPAATVSSVRNISASTAEPSISNCPIGAIYGKYN